MKSYSPVALAVAAAVLAGTASAQDVTALEEIVVTATKREQTLQDVPVAVTVTPVETIRRIIVEVHPGASQRPVVRPMTSRIPTIGARSTAIAPITLTQRSGRVPLGRLVALSGVSGSGKSTLLNILGGLDRPTAGSVRFGALEISTASDRELTEYRRHHVGFVFQFYNLIASLTARENVELVTEIADDPMLADDALRLVGLGERLTHFPSQLSGGEQQRVAIARAIAKRPAVLLCDEPTGALDVATGIRVLESLLEINTRLGTTTLLITHNADIARIGDRVVRFADGVIRSIEVNPERMPPSSLHW